jgi:hypothetical protein
MSYPSLVDKLATATGASLLAAYHDHPGEFAAVGAAILLRADHRAVALSDLALAAYLTRARRRPVPALGLTVAAGTADRLGKALGTLTDGLQDRPDPDAHVVRLGKGEPASTAKRSYLDAMRGQGVTGWVRATNGEACELCTWLAAKPPSPPDAPFYSHANCSCTPVPVTE